VSDVLAGLALLLAALAAAGAILLPPGRRRAAAMLIGLALFPILILADQWHTAQIADLRDPLSGLIALGLAALAAAAGLGLLFRRWPVLLPLAIVAMLPFRVPLHAGGDSANLLVPLYLVIAGGVLAASLRDWRAAVPPPPPSGRGGPTAWVPRLLAAVVVLYAVGALYSEDFSKGLQNVCFFFVPFSLAYGLLREVEWSKGLLVAVLWVVGVEATAFVVVGSVEYLTRELFWNAQVIRSNDFHTYFRVNSVYWDPNIYGRYLALVGVIAMSALLWSRDRRAFGLLAGLLAVVWIGLAPTFSQSSFAALLGGLAVLAALRWSLRWTLVATGVCALAGVLVVLFAGGTDKLSPDRLNVDTGGRANLVSGGLHLFAKRPAYGYGSGSFPKAYRQQIDTDNAPVSVSHTEPITVAAESGLIGLVLYAALLAAALWAMAAGLRPSLSGSPTAPAMARAAVLAAFAALIVHSMAYAGFFEDPNAWVLLAAGASLAHAAPPPPRNRPSRVSACRDTSAV
jgi:O-antigen ligase